MIPNVKGPLTEAAVTRRQWLRFLAWAGAAALAPRARPARAEGARVRVGLRPDSFSSWPLEYAVAAGLFREQGIDAELVYLGDETAVARALAGGQVEVGVLPPPLFYAVHLGTGEFSGKARPLVTWQVALVNGSSLVVPKSSGVEFSRQFRGKTFGVSTLLSMPALLTEIYVLQSGLVPGQDVTWSAEPKQSLRRKLAAGELGALAVEEWLPAELVRAGQARVMLPLHKLWNDHPADWIAAGRELGQSRPEVLERTADATLRASLALERRDFSALKEKYPAGRERPSAWESGLAASGAGFSPFPFLSAARILLEEMKKRKQAPPDVDFKAIAEATCLTGLARSGMKRAGFPEVPAEDSRDERMIGCCYTFF